MCAKIAILALALVASGARAWTVDRFNISTFCDPVIISPGPIPNPQMNRLKQFSDMGFNTLSGAVCVDATTTSYSDYVSLEYNDNLTREIGRWNTANGKKIRRFISSMNFEDHSDGLGTGVTPGSYSSKSFIQAAMNQFGRNYAGPREVIAGYFLGDEPILSQMPTVRRMIDDVRSIDPTQIIRVNLFANYAEVPAIGSSYGTYVEQLTSKNLPILGMDTYIYDKYYWSPSGYFSNFDLLAQIAKSKNSVFWPVLLSTGHDWYADPTESGIRYQLTTALAYGAKSVEWYSYRTLSFPTYSQGLDQNATKEALFTQINGELGKVGNYLISLNYIETFHGSGIDPITTEPLKRVLNPAITRKADPYLVMGVFKDPTGKWALIVGNKNRSSTSVFTIRLPALASCEQVSKSTGLWSSLNTVTTGINSEFTLTIAPGDYQIVRLATKSGVPMFRKPRPANLN